MIKHIVMFKLKENAEGGTAEENAAKCSQILMNLPSRIDFIRSMEVGINYKASARALDLVLIAEFDTKEDLESYIIHPAHVAAADFIMKVRNDAYSVDYEV